MNIDYVKDQIRSYIREHGDGVSEDILIQNLSDVSKNQECRTLLIGYGIKTLIKEEELKKVEAGYTLTDKGIFHADNNLAFQANYVYQLIQGNTRNTKRKKGDFI